MGIGGVDGFHQRLDRGLVGMLPGDAAGDLAQRVAGLDRSIAPVGQYRSGGRAASGAGDLALRLLRLSRRWSGRFQIFRLQHEHIGVQRCCRSARWQWRGGGGENRLIAFVDAADCSSLRRGMGRDRRRRARLGFRLFRRRHRQLLVARRVEQQRHLLVEPPLAPVDLEQKIEQRLLHRSARGGADEKAAVAIRRDDEAGRLQQGRVGEAVAGVLLPAGDADLQIAGANAFIG